MFFRVEYPELMTVLTARVFLIYVVVTLSMLFFRPFEPVVVFEIFVLEL